MFALSGPTAQFAAEYSQYAYISMLRSESNTGNYFELKTCKLGFPVKARETMI